LKRANGYGLYDMFGNVWEWVEDRYGDYVIDATGAALLDPRGPNTGSDRVRRGGGFDSHSAFMRAAFRYHGNPHYRYEALGFRVARSWVAAGSTDQN
jgi:formylglycine-generating enzyme required for sulfatase activity